MTARGVQRLIATAWRWPAVAGLAVLAAVAAFGYTGVARVDLTQRTDAERTLIRAAAPIDDAITALGTSGGAPGTAGGAGSLADSTQITQIREQMYQWIAGSVPLKAADESWGALDAPSARMAQGEAPKSAVPGGLTPLVDVSYRDTLRAHARLVAGRWPSDGAVRDPSTEPDTPPVLLESVVSSATARLLAAHPGTTLDITEEGRFGPMRVRLLVVGIIEPVDTSTTFWSAASFLAAPVYHAPLSSPPYWSLGVMLGPAQADALLSALSIPVIASWAFPIDSDATDADGAGALSAAIGHLENVAAAQYTGPALTQTPDDSTNTSMPGVAAGLELSSPLPSRLAPFLSAEQVEGLELAMPLAGLGLIAAVAALLLAAAAAQERAGELAARRARGAGARQLVARVLADGLITALPAAAVGAVAAFAIPGLTPAGTVATALVIAVAAALSPAVAVAWAEAVRRRARRQAAKAPPPRSGVGARRWVVQGALVLACAGGLDLIHTQGLNPGGATDPYAAAAPVLAAVPLALITLNLLPPFLRTLLHSAASRRGLVGLLGLAQAADAPLPVQAADLVATAGVSTAGLTFAVSRLSRRGAGGVLASATHQMFTALGWAAVAATLLAVAVAARLGVRTRRAAALQLGAIGLTGGQARAAAIVQTAVPVLAGVLGGTVAALALSRLAAPALGAASIPLAAADLAVPALGALTAIATGSVGNGARAAGRHEPAAALRV